MGSPIFWTPKMEASLEQFIKEGVPFSQIGRLMKMSARAATDKATKMGLRTPRPVNVHQPHTRLKFATPRTRPWTKTEDKKLIDILSAGGTQTEVCALLDRTAHSVGIRAKILHDDISEAAKRAGMKDPSASRRVCNREPLPACATLTWGAISDVPPDLSLIGGRG